MIGTVHKDLKFVPHRSRVPVFLLSSPTPKSGREYSTLQLFTSDRPGAKRNRYFTHLHKYTWGSPERRDHVPVNNKVNPRSEDLSSIK